MGGLKWIDLASQVWPCAVSRYQNHRKNTDLDEPKLMMTFGAKICVSICNHSFGDLLWNQHFRVSDKVTRVSYWKIPCNLFNKCDLQEYNNTHWINNFAK